MGLLGCSAGFSWAIHLVLAGLTLVIGLLLASLEWSQLVLLALFYVFHLPTKFPGQVLMATAWV